MLQIVEGQSMMCQSIVLGQEVVELHPFVSIDNFVQCWRNRQFPGAQDMSRAEREYTGGHGNLWENISALCKE